MNGSTQEIRGYIIRQIRVVLSKFLQDVNVGSATIRILGDTPTSILDPEDYLASIYPFVSETEECLKKHHPDNTTRFIATTIYRGKHSYFVLDLNNNDYTYETAHECKTIVPVYVLRLSKRQPTIFRKRELDETIAETLRDLHDCHGQDPLPLFDNHYEENRCYRHPRSLVTSSTD
ncbi:hypothetical protein ANOM_011916 [Aspergillus nomiae NRRL 13137]|uniref:Uncharacterized protein n=1 Tax=Aspergillus nomiae NRRL (strain ATCC 15546 / NRRL 13137 / CBS 260.88 / M93) TaxID=1509407 RepID=A0A0L1IK77_ASPN3|nr:uncharacterized protein ANOM_011916 [Aspergillus nomiae NRRL 13137]KNG79991.1 hypothetical protein ANOM_011916 [Aspergillus nomiae NRRL 13137]